MRKNERLGIFWILFSIYMKVAALHPDTTEGRAFFWATIALVSFFIGAFYLFRKGKNV